MKCIYCKEERVHPAFSDERLCSSCASDVLDDYDDRIKKYNGMLTSIQANKIIEQFFPDKTFEEIQKFLSNHPYKEEVSGDKRKMNAEQLRVFEILKSVKTNKTSVRTALKSILESKEKAGEETP
jgi:hypothetical protein